MTTISRKLEQQYGPEWGLNSRAKEHMNQAIRQGEESDPGYPVEIYDEKALVSQMQANMISSLRSLGLELREHWVRDIEAVKEYLAVRFMYFSDDLPELDPLRQLGI